MIYADMTPPKPKQAKATGLSMDKLSEIRATKREKR
jgi:hypothetical protein